MEYKLIRSRRRTLCLEIRDASIVVRAPLLYPRFKIDQFVRTKEGWVLRHLEKAKERSQKKPNEIYLNGKKHFLEVITLGEKGIKIVDGKVIIVAKNGKHAAEQIKDYLRSKTKEKVESLLKKYIDISGESYNRIVFKFYKSKWGSCSSQNNLSFNAVLAMAPEEVVEYVVIHEIVHIKIKNHSSKFWKRVEELDPKYKSHRKWLVENRDMLRL